MVANLLGNLQFSLNFLVLKLAGMFLPIHIVGGKKNPSKVCSLDLLTHAYQENLFLAKLKSQSLVMT